MKKKITVLFRIIIALLFVVSAIAKMYPSPYFAISTFEVKQLYPLGFSETIAAWFSRILIGIELALGVLLLQNNYLKKVVIPATFTMLAVFIIHLSYVTISAGGSTGSCGCFGELLPMTPLEAIAKNAIAMAILVILFLIQPNRKTPEKIWPIVSISLLFLFLVFILAPIKFNTSTTVQEINPVAASPSVIDPLDTIKDTVKEVKQNTDTLQETKPKEESKEIMEPASKKSGYELFFPTINKGQKTLCFFVPGCDHCMQAAKELNELSKKNKNFPKISVIFMNEEPEKIPDFFKFAGTEFPYTIIEIIPFWKLLGTGKDTPGVKYLWNGNEYKYYYGTTQNQFNPKEYQVVVSKSYKELTK